MNTLRIGTRNSPLALAQARWVAAELKARMGDGWATELVSMTTTGDQLTDRSLIEAGGKGLFTKELDLALYEHKVDILVHSLKDVPTRLPEGQDLLAYPKREDPRDCFVSIKFERFEDLPHGAVLGTSSLRRKAQALAIRPDLDVVEFRGNVQTRLKKLEDGVADATFLAAAGLNRLNARIAAHIEALQPEQFLPAIGQGILGIAAYPDRLSNAVKDALGTLDDKEARAAAFAERAALKFLDGSCRTPISGHLTKRTETEYLMRVGVYHPSGKPGFQLEQRGSNANWALADFEALGLSAAKSILEKAGGTLPHLAV